MGCDGGSIPQRQEMVHYAKKAEKIDKHAQSVARWKHCALSKLELTQPIVACGMGKLYNRESILEHLLDPTKYGDASITCPHVKSVRDVTTLHLHENSDKEQISTSYKATHEHAERVKFFCPVTLKEMNGTTRFCYLGCGCVVAEQALVEVEKGEGCPSCGKAYLDEDVVPIYSERAEDTERLSLRVQKMHREYEQARIAKKAEKKARQGDEVKDVKRVKTEKAVKVDCADYDYQKVNESMNLPSLKTLLRHKDIDSKAVQGIYLSGPLEKTNPLFSGSFSRRG